MTPDPLSNDRLLPAGVESIKVNHARRIGPFVLAEMLGEGRGTILYRAVRPEGARPPHEVCMRIARDPTDAITTARIRHEYEILRSMDNPRIPKAYGHYAEEGALAMSYFSGATLADALQATRDGLTNLAVSTALDIVIEVAHGLHHGHSTFGPDGNRIVHGHIGPQRIRLTPGGEIVVVGFGAHTKGRHPPTPHPKWPVVKSPQSYPTNGLWGPFSLRLCWASDCTPMFPVQPMPVVPEMSTAGFIAWPQNFRTWRCPPEPCWPPIRPIDTTGAMTSSKLC